MGPAVVRMKAFIYMQNTLPKIDRGAIFSDLLRRQVLRREARLPLLDVRAEYHRAVEQALWRRHVELNHERVRAAVLAQLRAKHGERFGGSWGGRMAVSLLAQQALQNSFRNQ